MELQEVSGGAVVNAKQSQIHDILFSREISWQEIIYDLINTEELDPWDINIMVLSEKYLEKVQQFENTDFFISSKVLFAASLLLRIKTELLLNKHLKSIDEILFGEEEKTQRVLERIELDEEIPELIPKSPIPRFKKLTLQELVDSLNKAITTENRRIKKEIINRNALRETGISLPKRKFSNKNQTTKIFNGLVNHFEENKEHQKVSFTNLIGEKREERIFSFLPLLQLENQKKVWLEQDVHFDEIHIWLRKVYFDNNPDPYLDLKREIEEIE
jgi:segregation and condensation protein A